MLDTPNTNVLGEFELNADTIEWLKASKIPEAITVDGEVQAVVIDAQSYQKLLEEVDYAVASACKDLADQDPQEELLARDLSASLRVDSRK